MLRIKLVEVENFKSFSSRISLPLESGLNVINGPNGTGKSNLLDAICCAFGCEPKLLRVNNYSDLLNAQVFSINCSIHLFYYLIIIGITCCLIRICNASPVI